VHIVSECMMGGRGLGGRDHHVARLACAIRCPVKSEINAVFLDTHSAERPHRDLFSAGWPRRLACLSAVMEFSDVYVQTGGQCRYSPDGASFAVAAEHRLIVRDADTMAVGQTTHKMFFFFFFEIPKSPLLSAQPKPPVRLTSSRQRRYHYQRAMLAVSSPLGRHWLAPGCVSRQSPGSRNCVGFFVAV
jgi:hypothetical protein